MVERIYYTWRKFEREAQNITEIKKTDFCKLIANINKKEKSETNLNYIIITK